MKATVAIWMYDNDNGNIPKKELISELQRQDVTVIDNFDLNECYILNGDVFLPSGEKLNCVDILYHMYADHESIHQREILWALENKGVTVINGVEAYLKCRDKFIANFLLRESGVDVPESALLNKNVSLDVVKSIFERWNAVVYKPREGHGAIGIIKFIDAEQFYDFIQYSKPREENFYIEKFINFGDRDYRVEIIGGNVIGGYSRVKSHGFKTNVTSGGVVKECESTGSHIDLALKAARVLNIDGTIVDMVKSIENDRFYVLETNYLLGVFVEAAVAARYGHSKNILPDFFREYDHKKLTMLVDYIMKKIDERRNETGHSSILLK
ncbi:alpha-L-glutamate ligase [Pectobacteriaceae bacterium CE90]|nr:alpha-L-glutamate ligase [Pectobacteriaceae bacterium CE90]